MAIEEINRLINKLIPKKDITFNDEDKTEKIKLKISSKIIFVLIFTKCKVSSN